MTFSEPNLRGFFATLPIYEQLPLPARAAFLSIQYPCQTYSQAAIAGSAEVLREAGFLRSAGARDKLIVPAEHHNFIRTLRALKRFPVFESATAEVFEGYMGEHLSYDERVVLTDENASSSDRAWLLFREIASPEWINNFLNAPNADWEKPYLKAGMRVPLLNGDVLEAAKGLINLSLGREPPIRFGELAASSPNPELLLAAMRACLRYALLFASLSPASMEPILGLWPGVKNQLNRTPVPPPQAVTPGETYESAFLIEDMKALLIACASQPIRLRANDTGMFAKVVRDLAKLLPRMPGWVEETFDFDAEMRVQTAAAYLQTFELVQHKGLQLEISARGLQWLARSAGQRLRVVIDGVIDRPQIVAGLTDLEGVKIGVIPQVHVRTALKPLPVIGAAVCNRFTALEPDRFFPIGQIVAYAGDGDNPFLGIFRRDRGAEFVIGNRWVERPDPEKLRQAWMGLIQEFVRVRLLPLGGVRLGRGERGASIAITPVGRYYLGQTEEWGLEESSDAQVIVQPNFEVTFLGEAPGAEAEIARFAERRGQGMGALFQITKKSVFAAAVAGMKAAEAQEILDRVCARELPANVRREIAGWFAQCRDVTIESAMLIRCPDRETALRVIGLTKGSAVPLSDTVLEYKDPSKQRAWLVKKLKEMGVRVSVVEEAKSDPVYLPRWRRRW